jgi:hypothetical protein
MQSLGAHEQIRLKITAFLFNSRADALRGEMYQAICLHVLSEMGGPVSREDMVELVAYALGENVQVTDSLRAVVLEELRRLTEGGVVLCEDEQYSLSEEVVQLPDETGQERLFEAILEELREIALSITPYISEMQLNSLLGFYLDVSSIVAQHRRLATRCASRLCLSPVDVNGRLVQRGSA